MYTQYGGSEGNRVLSQDRPRSDADPAPGPGPAGYGIRRVALHVRSVPGEVTRYQRSTRPINEQREVMCASRPTLLPFTPRTAQAGFAFVGYTCPLDLYLPSHCKLLENKSPQTCNHNFHLSHLSHVVFPMLAALKQLGSEPTS